MRRPGIAPLLRATAAAALVTTLAACGGGDPEPVGSDALAAHVKDAYTPDEGVTLQVDCPDPLAPEKGATAVCTVGDEESETGVRFTTKGVEGGEVAYDTMPFLSGGTVAETLTHELEAQGFAVDALECPDPLDGSEGASASCSVTSNGEDATITVSTTELDGLRIGFNWEVDQ